MTNILKKEDGTIKAFKYVAALVVSIMAIASPFLALGGFHEKFRRIESDQEAQATEIKMHEKEDTQKEIALAQSLGAINENLKNISSTVVEVKVSQQNIWHKITTKENL